MLKIFIACLVLGLSSSQNVGFVLSRGASDMNSYLVSATPDIFLNYNVSYNSAIYIKTRDFVAVEITINQINLNNFIMSGRNSINTTLADSNYVYMNITGFAFTVNSNFSEVGFNKNVSGSAVSYVSNSNLTLKLVAIYFNGKVALTVDSITFVPGEAYTIANKLSRRALKAINSEIMLLLNNSSIVQMIKTSLTSQLLTYANNNNFEIEVPTTNIALNASLIYPGIYTSATYLAYMADGTFVYNNEAASTSLVKPASMPSRVPEVTIGETQAMISVYMLQSYFSAYSQQYPQENVTSLPSAFGNILSTTTGYFPELFSLYGACKLSYNVSMLGIPTINVISDGLFFRMTLQMKLFTVTGSTSNPVSVFQTVLDYQCSPTLVSGSVIGNCISPRITTLTVTNPIVQISIYNLQRFMFDLIQASFLSGYTGYAFPAMPLNYPPGTKFTINKVVYADEYFVIQYIPTYLV